MNTKKIAHLMIDEKFINTAIRLFECEFPKQNHYFIFSPKPWKSIVIKNDLPIFEVGKKDILKLSLIELKRFDLVIIHGLQNIFLLIILISRKINFVWIGWGFDYYQRRNELDSMSIGLYQEMTLDYLIKNNSEFSSLPIHYRILNSNLILKFILNKIKIFSPVLYNEFDLVKRKYNLNKLKYQKWNYGSIDHDYIKNIDNIDISGNDILFGNSATPTNNHLECLNLLSKISVNKKIYTPLSYGDSNYANYIIKEGKKLLHSNFIPLVEFISFEEYLLILSRCRNVIQNQIRQQAIGNIIVMIYLGANVFLNAKSINYTFFKKIGVYIYSIDDLVKNPRLLDSKLSAKQINKNRELVNKYWSEQTIRKNTRDLVLRATEN
ncbi:TDP-N-acetylfucosamine:lipid II N-acetylfucosaminyltransferase [Providencia stuartii]|uniref:TDP-N-acetylfucosamine:lipid II N-acetylfucosaminyltransferase n=1 Tax=Providencia stuartii TaxID=588 RepID=UPI00076B318F|nr:TDP-N-acetylfucosamine:lipid II N-acetylfucosaminyltransferase [Providencia stuartii]AMG67608.1 hypothetical protein AL507_14005 [Providencia stuartii]